MVAWTTGEPALTTEVGGGLTYIRENWEVIENAWNVDHTTLTGTGSSSGTHVKVTLPQSSAPTEVASAIILNAVDVSDGAADKAELFARHEDAEDVQITATDGTRYGLCGKQFLVLGSDNSVVELGTADGTSAFYVNDSANQSVASIDSDGRVHMAQATAPTVASGGSLYVDTSDALHYVNSATNKTILNTTVSDAQPGYFTVGDIYTAWATSAGITSGTVFNLDLSVKLTTIYSVTLTSSKAVTNITKALYVYSIDNSGSVTRINVYHTNGFTIGGYVTVIGKL